MYNVTVTINSIETYCTESAKKCSVACKSIMREAFSKNLKKYLKNVLKHTVVLGTEIGVGVQARSVVTYMRRKFMDFRFQKNNWFHCARDFT